MLFYTGNKNAVQNHQVKFEKKPIVLFGCKDGCRPSDPFSLFISTLHSNKKSE